MSPGGRTGSDSFFSMESPICTEEGLTAGETVFKGLMIKNFLRS